MKDLPQTSVRYDVQLSINYGRLFLEGYRLGGVIYPFN